MGAVGGGGTILLILIIFLFVIMLCIWCGINSKSEFGTWLSK